MMIVDSLGETTRTGERYQVAMSEMSRLERQMSAFTNITSAINRSDELPQILNVALAEIANAINLNFSAIWLWDNETRQLRPSAYLGLPDTLVQDIAKSEAKLGVVAPGTDFDQSSFLRDVTALLQKQAERYKLTSVLNIPLNAQRQLAGIMVFFGYEAAILTGEDRAFLNTVANQVGTAIYNSRLFEQVQDYTTNLEREVAARTADLTAANEKLKTARDLANEASRAKSAFLANMSHELRTPLNAILGYSELLQEEAQDMQPDFIPPLQKINTAGRHLLNLLSGILDLSKIEAGKMLLQPENFKVSHLVDEVANTILPLVEKNTNRLEVICPDNPGTMWADMTKVRQVLYNLLSNACKFTDKGLIKLEVRREVIESADWITFKVRDTGIGISPETMKKLFNEFTQADASTTRKYGGTGLGLVISQRFCQMMGGQITAESEPGKGSTFTIHLPAHIPGGEIPPFRDDPEPPPFLDEE